MITPTFPLGLALADTPQNSMLMVRLFENTPPAGGFTDINQFVQLNHPDIGVSGVDDWYDADVIDVNMVWRRSHPIDFRSNSVQPGKSAKGFYVTIVVAGVANVIHWEAFDAPIMLDEPGKNVNVQVTIEASDVAFITP